MLKKEFTELTGIEVSDKQYQVIDAMYSDCGDMDKQQFCRDYKEYGSSKVLEYYYNAHNAIVGKYHMLKSATDSMAFELIIKSCAYNDDDLARMAISIIGETQYVLYKLSEGLELSKMDKDILIELIS